MPLTPAEKMRRYREKLKNDPERYEEYKKKDLKRIKLKNKKITELSENEKVNQRQKWREQKRKQKAKKTDREKNKTKNDEPTSSQTPINVCMNKKHLITIRRLRRMYETAINNNKELCKTIQKTRKQIYRLKVANRKTIDNFNDKIIKMKAREEVLESALRSAYNKTKSQADKRVLRSVANTVIVKKNRYKSYVAKLLGLRGRIRIIQPAQKLRRSKISEELKLFFLRDDISRSTSGKKECKTVNKEKHQIRYLTDKLFNLYKIYKNEGGRHSFATFFRYKPAYVLSPNIHNRNTCLCVKHSNMEMMFLSLLRNGAFPENIKSLSDVISKLSCDQGSYNCMYGRCTICEHFKLEYSLVGEALLKTVYWEQWERVDHCYEKMEKGVIKKYITKKTIKNQKHGKLAELKQIFEKNIPLYKIHIYNFKHQQRKYREKIQTLGPHEALILCDFSENYECKLHQEVQATHFGASKNQITLHCGMIYWASGSQSFCSVSDNKCHEPHAIWGHLLPVIQLLKSKCPDIKRIHFFSDGPSSQYRQKKNFFLLNFYTTKLGFDMCTWNFSESGHGKGVADGIGGSVKRTLDKQVAYSRDITNGKEVFEILKSISKSIQFFFIEESDIEMVQERVPIGLKPVPGTMQIHQVLSFANSAYLLNRLLSCFCQIEKESETCNCYELKKHLIQNSPVTIGSSNTSLPSTSKITSTLTNPLLINLGPVQNLNDENLDLDNYLLAEAIPPNLPILYLNNSSPDITENYNWDEKVTECLTETFSDSIVPVEDRDDRTEEKSGKEIFFEKIHAPVITIPLNETQIINKSNMYDSQSNSKKAYQSNIYNTGNSSDNYFNRPASSTMFTKNVAKKNRSDTKENSPQNKNPSINTAISKSMECYACKKNTKFPSVDVTKCISCKQWFCINCSEGNNNFDFICRKCFGEDYIL